MNYGPFIVALFAALGVLAGKKPNVLTLLLSFVGAIALLITFPTLLSMGDGISGGWLMGFALFGLVLVLLATFKVKSRTGNVMIFVGIGMMAWALFRWWPTGPEAFLGFGQHIAAGGTEIWTGFLDFIKLLASKPPTL